MKTIVDKRHFLSSLIASVFLIYGIGESNSSYAKVILLILAIAWMGMAAWTDRERLFRIFQVHSVLYYCIFLSFFIVGVLFGNNYVLGLKYFGTYTLYLTIIFMYEFYSGLEDEKYLRIILRLCFLGFMFFVLKALIFYMLNPGAGRVLAAHPDYYGVMMIGGGYQLAYLATIISSYLLQRPTFRNVLISIILLVLLIKTESTITILIGLIGVLINLLAVFLKIFSKRDRILIMAVAFIIAILFFLFREKIGEMLLIISGEGDSSITGRIKEIGNLLRGDSLKNQNAIRLRVIVYEDSLNLIKRNPVLGGIFSYGVIPSYKNSGGHSDILDSISQWGLIFGGTFLAVFFSEMGKIKKILHGGWSCIVVIVLLMLLNPTIVFSLCAGIFFIVPAMGCLEFNKRKEKLQ